MSLIIKSTPLAFLLVILASYCVAIGLLCYECEDSIADNDFSCHYEDNMSKRKIVHCDGGSCFFETNKFGPATFHNLTRHASKI